MQIVQSCDNHLLSDMKVKLEIPARQGSMAPSRSLPRCASELGDPPSPFSSNPSHHPVSMPTTPAGVSSSSSSFGCMVGKPSATDSPPATPGRGKHQANNKALMPGAAAVAAYYASQWSPRRLMQRAARAFRTSRSRRFRVERASSPTAGKVSDVAAIGGGVELAAVNDGHVKREEEEHPDAVPEKIIHEMKRHSPPVGVVKEDEEEFGMKTTPEMGKEKETATPAAAEEEVVESPKKGEAVVPEADLVAVIAGEEVAEKLVTVVKEAIKKSEEEQGGEKKSAAVRKFQSKVKTAMEARSESEQPRRREAARGSNDVIEEARSMLVEKRQCSRVRALVGAFETVMDNTSKEVAAAATPRSLSRNLSRRSA